MLYSVSAVDPCRHSGPRENVFFKNTKDRYGTSPVSGRQGSPGPSHPGDDARMSDSVRTPLRNETRRARLAALLGGAALLGCSLDDRNVRDEALGAGSAGVAGASVAVGEPNPGSPPGAAGAGSAPADSAGSSGSPAPASSSGAAAVPGSSGSGSEAIVPTLPCTAGAQRCEAGA